MPKSLFLLLALGACAPLVPESAVPGDTSSWSGPSEQLPPPTFPIELTGTIMYRFAAGIPIFLDLVLYDDGTVDGTAELTLGAPSPTAGTWRSMGRGVTIDLADLGVISGRPVRGCLAGQSTQPTPPVYVAAGAPAMMQLRWDLCIVP